VVALDDAANGVNAGVRNTAIAHVEGEESGVVLESAKEMRGAGVIHPTGSDVEVLQTLCCGLGITRQHAPAAESYLWGEACGRLAVRF
jgi:hypothetical protein